jgi:hypothetical protein
VTGSQIVRNIALAMIAVSVANLVMTTLLTGPSKVPVRLVGLVGTCVFAFLLIRGVGWVRWLAVIGNGFGVILGVITLSSLPSMGISLFSILAIWLVVTIVFSGFVAVYLAFSTRVSEHFDPGSGW